MQYSHPLYMLLFFIYAIILFIVISYFFKAYSYELKVSLVFAFFFVSYVLYFRIYATFVSNLIFINLLYLIFGNTVLVILCFFIAVNTIRKGFYKTFFLFIGTIKNKFIVFLKRNYMVILYVCIYYFIMLTMPIISPHFSYSYWVEIYAISSNNLLPPQGVPDLIVESFSYLSGLSGGAYPLILSIFYIIFPYWVMKLFQPTIVIILILNLKRILIHLKILDKNFNINYFVLLLLFSPMMITFFLINNDDVLVSFFLSLGILYAIEFNKSKKSKKILELFILGFISSFPIVIKYTGVLTIYPVASYIFYNKKLFSSKKMLFCKELVSFSFGQFLLFFLYLIRNVLVFHNPFPPYSFFRLDFLESNNNFLTAYLMIFLLCLVVVLSILLGLLIEIKISNKLWYLSYCAIYIFVLALKGNYKVVFNTLKIILFSVKLGDVSNSFGLSFVVILLTPIINKLGKRKTEKTIKNEFSINNTAYLSNLTLKSGILILLLEIVIWDSPLEGPVRYSFSYLIVSAILTYSIIVKAKNTVVFPNSTKLFKRSFRRSLNFKKVKSFFQTFFNFLLILVLLSGLPFGYVRKPFYPIRYPLNNDVADLQNWKSWQVSPILFVNELLITNEFIPGYIVYTDSLINLFFDPLIIITFSVNSAHRNRLFYNDIVHLNSTFTVESNDTIKIEIIRNFLLEWNVSYFVTSSGYVMDSLTDTFEVLNVMLNSFFTISYREQDTNKIFGNEENYGCTWEVNLTALNGV